MGLRELFFEHIRRLQFEALKIFQEVGIDGLVLSAGQAQYFFEDDQTMPFRSNHYFRHWCPMEGPAHVLIISDSGKPLLRVLSVADYWHESKSFESDYWTDAFEVVLCHDKAQLWAQIAQTGRFAYCGSESAAAEAAGLSIHTGGLKERLNWLRLEKSAYEVQCIREATRKAALGHRAAERCFRQGGSELDIHFTYLQATRSIEADLPYESIVALNEKAAVLHYGQKRDEVHSGRVLLIDAGASYHGYGSDITRTYATEDAPEEFRSLLKDMESLQAALVSAIQPGMTMIDLHIAAHRQIAQLLINHRLIMNCSAEAALEEGLSRVFFPHGLGHMLGIFVHDVAGKQLSREGGVQVADQRFPSLRTAHPLKTGTVITIEPGLYFIKMLLQPLSQEASGKYVNWPLVNRLASCGGIRIEDNIHISDRGVQNLTREHLP